MNGINKFGASATLAALMLLPGAAFADHFGIHMDSGVWFGANGIVRVFGAEVSAVSGNFLNAFTSLGNVILNWNVNATSTTNIFAGGKRASLSDISVGDRISFVGSTTSTTSLFTVVAKKIRDLSTNPVHGLMVGTVSNVNDSAGNFTLNARNHTIAVQTNASTTISTHDNAAATFASIQNGDRVKVGGTLGADGSTLVASRIIIKEDERDDDHTARAEEKSELKAALKAARDEAEDLRDHGLFLRLFERADLGHRGRN